MSEKYGRLFTENDVRLIAAEFGSRIVDGCVRAHREGREVERGWVAGELEAAFTDEAVNSLLTFPADEPTFLLRGQDRAAWASIEHYVSNCVAMGAPVEHCVAAERAADAMHGWQAQNPGRVKAPD